MSFYAKTSVISSSTSFLLLHKYVVGVFVWCLLKLLLGAMAILLVAIWMGSYEDGFAWNDDPDREFHYHPTLMIMGMVFLYGEALIVYRVFRHERKKFSKTLHVAIHSMVCLNGFAFDILLGHSLYACSSESCLGFSRSSC